MVIRNRARLKKTAGPQTAEAPDRSAGGIEVAIDPEDIARVAYSYWEARGFSEGSAEEDWFRAERALRVTKQCADGGR